MRYEKKSDETFGAVRRNKNCLCVCVREGGQVEKVQKTNDELKQSSELRKIAGKFVQAIQKSNIRRIKMMHTIEF